MACCRDCGKPLKWIKTADGKFIPCDPIAYFYGPPGHSELGEQFVSRYGVIEYGKRLDDPEPDCQLGYVPHWVSCTKRDRAQGSRWA